MKTDIKIGLIGAGAWGQNHLRVLGQMGVLAAVADTSNERLEQIKKDHDGIKTTESYKELLAMPDIDAVVIATPAFTHFKIAEESLAAGKHTFVEKPLSLTKKEGEMLVFDAKRESKLLMVGHLLHYHPAIIELKKVVDRGELGKILHIAAHRLNLGKIRTEENVMWSIAPHDISLILSFFQDVPQTVHVEGASYIQKNIPDMAHIHLHFSENRNAHIYTSWLNPYKERKFTIIGDKGMAVFDDMAADKLVIYNSLAERDERNNPVSVNNGTRIVELPNTEPVLNELTHFVTCIESNTDPLTDGAEGVRVLSVLEQCA